MTVTTKPVTAVVSPVNSPTTSVEKFVGSSTYRQLWSALFSSLEQVKEAEPPSSPASYKAYSSAWNASQKLIADAIDSAPDDVGYIVAGLGTGNTGDQAKADVKNSLMSTWDAAAGPYVKGDDAEGDAASKKLFPRLAEFDEAVTSKGSTPVAPD